MKNRVLLLFMLAAPLFGQASHIVGGEFELIHIQGFEYRLNMILYFDVINGNPGARDNFVAARIFRMVDNVRMMDVSLPLISESNVEYTQPECSHGELITRKLLYSAALTLSADSFGNPGGYYVAWERCCRNYTISNIFSEVPGVGPNFAGQTFYLEFPPVVKDGQPFVDSTPRLFPPLNDFGCPRRPYYTDFGGTDDDGDSLVYSLVTPLNTKSADAIPPGGPRPRPYPDVTWRAPYGLNNILHGTPDLRISKDGFLTVTPGSQGLFVFAVKVEEFRDHVKIGETRRDFQMLVVDACPVAVPPQILGKKLADATFTYDNTMNVFFDNSATDGQRCINVLVTDADSQSPDNNFQEKIRIKAFAMNFKKDLSGILPASTTATLMNGSGVQFTICFPACPYFLGGAPQIGIIAMDDACSLPLTDTLKINLSVEAPVNHKPYFTSATPVNATLPEGTQQAWPYVVKDDDNDPLVVSLITNGFVLSAAGMTFTTFHNTNGAADGELKWDAFCNIYDFTHRTAFQITVQVEDQDQCLIPDPAKAIYNLNVILPGNADPIVYTSLTPDTLKRSIQRTMRITESLAFTVTGKDWQDKDTVVLKGAGKDFAFGDYKISYSPLVATGKRLVNGTFQWEIKCASVDPEKKDTFTFQFIAVDNKNKCRQYKADTVDVEVKVLPPLNQPPSLSITNNNAPATLLQSNAIAMTLGPAIDLLLTGTDADVVPDKDSLKIELVSKDGNVAPVGYSFEPVEGKSPLQTKFTWQPDCSIFKDGVFENEYAFTFFLNDDHCLTAKKDSVTFTLKIKDVDGSDTDFRPPNFFSPNGDKFNEYYAMEEMDGTPGEVRNILPNDNCDSRFETVRIVNRWGIEVFRSNDRNFRWFAEGESAGVYYYFIKYTKKEYRGSISLRY